MKTSQLALPIFLFGLLLFFLTSCTGIIPIAPAPSPGTTEEDATAISGQIKMPLICCVPIEKGSETEKSNDETEFWSVIPGAIIELKSSNNCKKVLDTTESDESGNYTFQNVKPGMYIITAYCPSSNKYLIKDVVEKVFGQALDAGTPDCSSTSLALIAEYFNGCYNEWYPCFNKYSAIYKKVKTIAEAIDQVDLVVIENNKTYDELVALVCDVLQNCCGTSPGATPSPGGGTGGGTTPVTETTISVADISGIKAPVTGETPVTLISGNISKSTIARLSKSTEQYTGTVSWEPNHNPFQGNTVYTATITLTPTEGFTFKGIPANFFKVEGAESVSNSAGSGIVTAVFPKTEPLEYTVTFKETNKCKDVSIQIYNSEACQEADKVGDPITTNNNGEANKDLPDGNYWFIAKLIGYKDYKKDFKVEGIDKTVEFTMVETEYAVSFKEKNELTGVSIQLYSDAARTVSVGNVLTTNSSGIATANLSNGSYWFTASLTGYDDFNGNFEVDGSAKTVEFTMIATVSTVDIEEISGVTPPVAGATPVTAITETAQYTGTVDWSPNNSPFEYDTPYTATITLAAKSGFTFNGVAANFFTVAGADPVSNDANSGVVTAVFPKTAIEKFTVTFPDPEKGSLSAKVDDVDISSGDEIEKGKSVVFTASPDSGYQVKGWKLNNNPVGSTELTYTVNSLSSDIEVEVEFEEESITPPIGLILHLDANDYSTGNWPDISGTGNIVSQNTAANQPSLIANGLNGNPVVRFDGEDDYLDLGWNFSDGSLTTDSITIIMVMKSNNMDNSQTLMGNYNESGDVCFHVSYNQNALTATVSSRDNRIDISNSTEPYVATYKVTPTSHTTYVNGVESESDNLTENIDWGTTTIGKNGGTLSSNIQDWFWEGDIAEIRIYNYALDDTDRAAVESELQTKWLSGGTQPSGDLILHLDANHYNSDTGIWADLSSFNNEVSQTSSSNRPAYISDGLNGNPVVRFDGENDYLNLNWNLLDGSLITDSITMFLVLKNDDMDGGTQVVMGNYNSDNEVSISISSQNDSIVARITDYKTSCTFTNESGPYVLTFDYDSSTMRTFVNSVLANTFNTNENIEWGNTAIGRDGAGTSRYWSGDIAEIRIYDSVLSDPERQTIESELQAKWLTGGGPGTLSDAIVIYSDPQNSSNHPATVAHVLTINPHTVLISGDLVNYDSTTEWNTFNNLVDDYNLLYTARGNHDGSTNWDGRYYNYYSDDINLGGYTVHLIVLDTNDSGSGGMVLTGDIGDTQKTWFEADLQENSSADFIIVSFHHPVYSSGSHGGSSALQTKLVPLFEQYGVDMVFYGHDHTYEVNTVNDIHYIQTCGGSPRDSSDPNYCLLTVAGRELVGQVYDINGRMLGSSFSSETSGLLTGTIYQQVSSFTDGKNYIIAAKDETDYYAVKFNAPAEYNYHVLSESIEVIDGVAYGLEGTNIIVDPDNSDLVWTASENGERYNLSNSTYYLYGGKVDTQTGTASGSGTIDFYNLESSRPCDIEGTNFYAFSSNSGEYYLTFDNSTYEFGCSDAKAIEQASEVYIFEEIEIE